MSDAGRAPTGDSVSRILAAAEALFAESGFDAVSMNAIAEKAGVSKANVFHHFSSKNELYLAVLKVACQAAGDLVEDLGDASAPLAERLAAYARGHLHALLDHHPITRLIQRDLIENGPERGKEFAEQVFGQRFARIVAILRDGQARGELRPEVDPALVAVLVLGANLNFFLARDVFRHFPDVGFMDDPDRYSRMVMDVLLRGFAPGG